MTMTLPVVDTKVEQFLAVLDEDIRHLETTLSRLDALRSLLIKRDDTALEKLLGEVRGQGQECSANERMRQSLRTALARSLGWSGSRLTLSGLRAVLPEPQRAAVTARQEQLKSLVARLHREYTLTAVLVADCARFNRMLLTTLLGPAGQWGITYRPNGAARQQANAVTMSLQL
jgi:hypothetical protein